MSRTDKTDPYRVKVARLHPQANIYWRPEFRCCCATCSDPNKYPQAERRRGKRQVRDWQREYA